MSRIIQKYFCLESLFSERFVCRAKWSWHLHLAATHFLLRRRRKLANNLASRSTWKMIAPTNVNENNMVIEKHVCASRDTVANFLVLYRPKKFACRIIDLGCICRPFWILFTWKLKPVGGALGSSSFVAGLNVRGIKNAQNFLSRRWFQRLL